MKHDQRSELRKFFLNSMHDCDIAVTLTLKQHTCGRRLDSIEASKNLRHFLNRLDKKAFGNASCRFGKKVQVVSMCEYTTSGRLHYHLAMKNPFESFQHCHAAIIDCWTKTLWADREFDVQPMNDFGWISYITKAPTVEGWDVENTHL